MIKRLLPKGRQVTVSNSGKIVQVYLEGQEKTHVVHETRVERLLLKSLHTEKYRDLYNVDVHYLTPNDAGGYDSNIYSHRYTYDN